MMDQEHKPQLAPWHSRHIRLGMSAALVSGLLLAAGGLWLARIPLAEWAIPRTIMALGFGPAKATVTRLDFTGAEVLDLQFTSGAIDRVAFDYSFSSLSKGKVEQIEIYGADLTVVWEDSGIVIPGVRIAPAPPEPEASVVSKGELQNLVLPVQAIYVNRSTVYLKTSSHTITVALDGKLTAQAAPAVDFRFSAESALGRVTGRAGATLDPDGNARGSLKLTDGQFGLGTFRVADLTGDFVFSGTLQRLDDVTGLAALHYSIPGHSGLAPGQIEFQLSPNAGAANFQVTAPAANISFRADPADQDGRIDYRLDGELHTDTLAAFLKAGTVLKGASRFHFSGRSPQAHSLSALADFSPSQWLTDGQLEGSVELALTHIAFPGVGRAQGFMGKALLYTDKGGLVLNIPGELSISALAFAPDLIEPDTGLGRATARAGAIDLALYGPADGPFLHLAPQQGSYSAHLAAGFRVTASELSIRGSTNATLEPDEPLPGAVIDQDADSRPAEMPINRLGRFTFNTSASLRVGDTFTAEAISADLGGRYALNAAVLQLDKVGGHLEARDLDLDSRLDLPGTTYFTLDPNQTELKFDRMTELFTGSIMLTPLSLRGSFRSAAGESLAFDAAAESLSFVATSQKHQAVLGNGRVALPAQEVSAMGVTVIASRVADAVTLDIGMAEFRHTADPPFIAPLQSELSVRGDHEHVTFSASIKDLAHVPNSLLSARLTGQHGLLTGRGDAHVVLDPLELGPGRDRVNKLFPKAATEVTSAQGTVSLKGDFDWNSETTTASIRLGLSDVGFSSESLGLSALNGTIHLDGLAPPTTPSSQHLAAIADIPEIGRVPLDLIFRLEPGRLIVEHGAATLLGGRIEVHETAFEAAARVSQFDLRITDVDLAAISKLIDLEEIEGTGRLSGVLPTQIDSGQVAIVNGRLAATGAGTVRLATTALTDQFKGRGDTIDLTLRALSDFHYDQLTLDIMKPFKGDGAVLVHLEGVNPAVLEGYPFVFNIRLAADFDRLTRLLAVASEAGGQALDWGARHAKP